MTDGKLQKAGGVVPVAVRREPGTEDLPLPCYMSDGAAGMDLLAAVDESIELPAGKRALIPTGISIALPEGYEAQVRPRSGLAVKQGVTILNTPGTIDSDYRGEIRVILINLGADEYVVHRGDRIAQMIVAPYVRVEWKECGTLPDTLRSSGGFGHTGR